jgi:riboflavin transporter FmnP
MNRNQNTSRLTGTAILSALVIVFDYALKYSGLKIPFPWMPFLKFDFTGVPIVISLFLFDLNTSITVSLVAGLGILARSGDLLGAGMKVIAEVSTVIGLFIGYHFLGKRANVISLLPFFFSAVLRVVFMSLVNLIVLPNAYGVSFQAAIGMLPLLAVFNAIQGGISTLLGNFIFVAYQKRMNT